MCYHDTSKAYTSGAATILMCYHDVGKLKQYIKIVLRNDCEIYYYMWYSLPINPSFCSMGSQLIVVNLDSRKCSNSYSNVAFPSLLCFHATSMYYICSIVEPLFSFVCVQLYLSRPLNMLLAPSSLLLLEQWQQDPSLGLFDLER